MISNDQIIKEKIIKGLELTYKRLIQYKIERNYDLVVSDNGKVILIDPKKYMKLIS